MDKEQIRQFGYELGADAVISVNLRPNSENRNLPTAQRTNSEKENAVERRIEELLEQMTLEEKVSMVAGADWWHTTTVERLGIPAIKMTDGPHGARGATAWGGPSSVCFPVGTAMASTWNVELIGRVGAAIPVLASPPRDMAS